MFSLSKLHFGKLYIYLFPCFLSFTLMWRSFEIPKQKKEKRNTIQQDLESNYQNTVLNKHIPTALSCAFTEISGLKGCNYHVLHTSTSLFST